MAFKPATFMAAPPSAQGKNPADTLALSVKVRGPHQKVARAKNGEIFLTHTVMKHGLTPTEAVQRIQEREAQEALEAELLATK